MKTNEKSWLTVGVYRATECMVDGYYTFEVNKENLNYTNCPQLNDFDPNLKVHLTEGTMYAFRIAGLNTMGIAQWSKMFPFKTLDIEPPTAPNNCKFISTVQGLRLAWNPNPLAEKISKYSVYIATSTNHAANELNFRRIYEGIQPTCHVLRSVLDAAYHKINNNRESIMFRITASNSSGSSTPSIAYHTF